ncbi:signal peptide peptidase SppA [Haloarchaeobius salinus]|uniref:signal peptide peptidase SppA n=1 Tax=Haloarchaeobius salinus TaxID=1198298 RepID=UPI00210A15D5|nr:signal peptide peptidase SppA [Haloarchaeobius salinus]
MSATTRLGRLVVTVLGTVFGVLVGLFLFQVLPDTGFGTVEVLLTLATALAFAVVSGRFARNAFPAYNVAEVAVEGPITRDGGGSLVSPPGGATADEIVEQIDRADDDSAVDALLVKLNTPGGEVIPSDDIRLAAERFDGPTVAYSNDLCASGGYWIASGCDELWARDGTLVGSIGVRMGNLNLKELGDRVGVDYNELTAGEYKNAGSPFEEFTADDREYLQGLVDSWYDEFVDVVAEGRDLDDELVRDTEARVYLGRDAHELGLVDDLGTRDDVEAHVESLLGESVSVEEFRPHRRLRARTMLGATRVAYAAGAGVASVLGGDDEVELKL